MSNTVRDQSESANARTEAAEWFIRYQDGNLTIAERYAYLQWLKASSIHISETLRLMSLYQRFSEAARPRGWLRRILDKMTGQRSLADTLFEHADLSRKTLASDFAPGIYKDPRLTQFMPYRLQLRPRAALLDWLGRASDLGGTERPGFREH